MADRIVIYHGPDCVDGFTAAWAAWRCPYWTNAEFVPAHYGASPPDVSGKDVLVVDFSYPRAVLLEMEAAAKTLYVLDHHKTAQADLEGLIFAKLDMARSGAGITWDSLHRAARPTLIDYVEDRDLWRWKLSASREVSAWLGSWDRTFKRWDALATTLDSARGLEQAIDEGSAILRSLDRHVESQVGRHGWVALAGHIVPCINTTSCTSEIVGRLAESHPFAVGWFQRADGLFVYSLRSRGDGLDVSAIAKTMGGGGHRGAAGFTRTELLPVADPDVMGAP